MTMQSLELTALRSREDEILAMLASVREAIEAERLRLLTEQYGITIGSLVSYRGSVYKVCRIESIDVNDRPWLGGRKRLKGGSFAAKANNLFDDWEIIP